MKRINLNLLPTAATWRGNEYEMSEDVTIVSKHVGAWQFIN